MQQQPTEPFTVVILGLTQDQKRLRAHREGDAANVIELTSTCQNQTNHALATLMALAAVAENGGYVLAGVSAPSDTSRYKETHCRAA